MQEERASRQRGGEEEEEEVEADAEDGPLGVSMTFAQAEVSFNVYLNYAETSKRLNNNPQGDVSTTYESAPGRLVRGRWPPISFARGGTCVIQSDTGWQSQFLITGKSEAPPLYLRQAGRSLHHRPTTVRSSTIGRTRGDCLAVEQTPLSRVVPRCLRVAVSNDHTTTQRKAVANTAHLRDAKPWDKEIGADDAYGHVPSPLTSL
ncbi:hypothetical protein TcWFU_004721 [Taenia crassiceps]|uniref:Uncharacterized protein n=1 Tax=Taenia crassiceps TaxID=6207 RepID=A0ABR4Q9P3_9CEST